MNRCMPGRRGSRPTMSIRSMSRRTSALAGWPSSPIDCSARMASITSTRTSRTSGRTSSTPIPQAPRPRSNASGCKPSSPRCTSTRPPERSYSMRTLAPPVGRGWEFLTGTGWDFDREIDELPGLLAETRRGAERRGRPLRPGRSIRPTCGSPSTSRSATPPSSTAPSATRQRTPAPRSPPSTSSARCSTAQPGHERHRRPDGRARPGHDRL